MFCSRYLLNTFIVFCGICTLTLQQSIVAAEQKSDTVVGTTITPASSDLAKTSSIPKVITSVSAPMAALVCPQPEEMIKDGLKWMTKDGKWKNYTPSSADKIINFVGAQWVGIKVGTVLCLYQTNEAAKFTLELEQTNIQSILEPKGDGWSSMIGKNRKMCKSANVADCRYFVESAKDTSNVFDEIKYNPSRDN